MNAKNGTEEKGQVVGGLRRPRRCARLSDSNCGAMRMYPSLFVAAIFAALFGAVELKQQGGAPLALACQLAMKKAEETQQCQGSVALPHRTVAIGDIHGSYEGLLEDLFYANITSGRRECKWKTQSQPTVLVQMGDLVDRGPGALDSLLCLRTLQSEAAQHNAEVIRLFGNHELWWLTGIFYERHPEADTREKVNQFIRLLVDDILSGAVQAAHLMQVNNLPIVFVHAGYSPKFLKYLAKNKLHTPEEIVNYTNTALIKALRSCERIPCKIKGEVFDAGPDRGGRGIGGPLWTDFETLEKGVSDGYSPSFLQVVGHTMAFCYQRNRPNVHPPITQAECSLGLVRPTADLSSVCVDGGMWLGARAFLEIGVDGRMRSFERRGNEHEVPWQVRDMTQEICGGVLSNCPASG